MGRIASWAIDAKVSRKLISLTSNNFFHRFFSPCEASSLRLINYIYDMLLKYTHRPHLSSTGRVGLLAAHIYLSNCCFRCAMTHDWRRFHGFMPARVRNFLFSFNLFFHFFRNKQVSIDENDQKHCLQDYKLRAYILLQKDSQWIKLSDDSLHLAISLQIRPPEQFPLRCA